MYAATAACDWGWTIALQRRDGVGVLDDHLEEVEQCLLESRGHILPSFPGKCNQPGIDWYLFCLLLAVSESTELKLVHQR